MSISHCKIRSGKNYERSFDEFEVLLALLAADARNQNAGWVWGPVGRFGWKHFNYRDPPFKRVIEEAKAAGNEWLPLRSGLFGGSIELLRRLRRVSENACKLTLVVAKQAVCYSRPCL